MSPTAWNLEQGRLGKGESRAATCTDPLICVFEIELILLKKSRLLAVAGL